jgi:hypothetical protein
MLGSTELGARHDCGSSALEINGAARHIRDFSGGQSLTGTALDSAATLKVNLIHRQVLLRSSTLTATPPFLLFTRFFHVNRTQH